MSAIDALRDVLQVGRWLRDEEFGVHPYGSKAKRTLICPADPEHPLVVPGHSYLFKRAENWKSHQMWSEAIAYQLAAACGVDVPACFVAYDAATGETGALIEFFYGHPGEARPRRLAHGADLLQGAGLMRGDGRPHGVSTNVDFCRSVGIGDAAAWWGRTLAFDALIGNTDRHSQNWGLLTEEETPVAMAPVFDNGTSLGYQIADVRLAEFDAQERVRKFVAGGRHNCGWSLRDDASGEHIKLCRRFASVYPEAVPQMRRVLEFAIGDLQDALAACALLGANPAFTGARARFVLALILYRRDRLMDALDG